MHRLGHCYVLIACLLLTLQRRSSFIAALPMELPKTLSFATTLGVQASTPELESLLPLITKAAAAELAKAMGVNKHDMDATHTVTAHGATAQTDTPHRHAQATVHQNVEVNFLVHCGADGCLHEKHALDHITGSQMKDIIQSVSDSAFRDHFKTNFNWQSAVANDDKAVAAALQAPVFQFVELPSRGYGVIHGHWVHYTSTPTSLPTLSPSTPAPTNPTRAPTTAPTTPAPTLGACESYSVFYNGYCYATLDMADPSKNGNGCQTEYLAVPKAWAIAPYDYGVVEHVVAKNYFNTNCLCFQNGFCATRKGYGSSGRGSDCSSGMVLAHVKYPTVTFKPKECARRILMRRFDHTGGGWPVTRVKYDTYELFNTPGCFHWPEARKACQALGGDLVVVHDQTKSTRVTKLLKGLDYSKSPCKPYPHLGASECSRTPHSCKWVDGSKWDFTAFNSWSHFDNPPQSYLHVYATSSCCVGQWGSNAPDIWGTSYGICEKKVPAPPPPPLPLAPACPRFAVAHSGYCYATMDQESPDIVSGMFQNYYLPLPTEWELAPYDSQVRSDVIGKYWWGTNCVVFANGASYTVKDYGGGADCGGNELMQQGNTYRARESNRKVLMRIKIGLSGVAAQAYLQTTYYYDQHPRRFLPKPPTRAPTLKPTTMSPTTSPTTATAYADVHFRKIRINVMRNHGDRSTCYNGFRLTRGGTTLQWAAVGTPAIADTGHWDGGYVGANILTNGGTYYCSDPDSFDSTTKPKDKNGETITVTLKTPVHFDGFELRAYPNMACNPKVFTIQALPFPSIGVKDPDVWRVLVDESNFDFSHSGQVKQLMAIPSQLQNCTHHCTTNPTAAPTTAAPTGAPTTGAPTTAAPTGTPTTGAPTWAFKSWPNQLTSCGKTGPIGPTSVDCGSGYNSDVVTAIYSGYQKVVLPKAGFYKFAATGAMGGAMGKSPPGKGAIVSATFDLPANTVLYVLVGQKGGGRPACRQGGGGGGGASFVAIADAAGKEIKGVAGLSGVRVKPLLVAGGGAGANGPYWGCDENKYLAAEGGKAADRTGGGKPGAPCSSNPNNGGGWENSDQQYDHTHSTKPFLKGGVPRSGYFTTGWMEMGGFGGGAASCNSGGGGGGYYGGAACCWGHTKDTLATTGGTSYALPSATGYTGQDNANAGEGSVSFEWIPPPPTSAPTPVPPTSAPTPVCGRTGGWRRPNPKAVHIPVTWTGGVKVTGTAGFLERTSGSGWNGGATSVQKIDAGGTSFAPHGISFKVTGDTSHGANKQHAYFGIGNAVIDYNTPGCCLYAVVEFGFYIELGSRYPAESHALVTKFPPYNTVCQSKGRDDVYKIQVVGNTVQYLRNDELMYTSKKAPTFPLRIQCALEAKGTKFTDVTMF